jgi:hypothetical protein
MQLFSVLFSRFHSVSVLMADRIGVEKSYLCHNGYRFFWFVFFFLNSVQSLVTCFLCVGMALMGFTYAFGNFFIGIISY